MSTLPDDGALERAEQRTLLMPRRDQGAELPRGHALQEFVVEQVLGMGGYSVVYLAQDTKLQRKVAVKDYRGGAAIYNCYVPGLHFDCVARRGRRFGFALDDRFTVDAQHPAAIKVTYYDDQPWKLVYPTQSGPRERTAPCRGDGQLRTATFFVPDALLAVAAVPLPAAAVAAAAGGGMPADWTPSTAPEWKAVIAQMDAMNLGVFRRDRCQPSLEARVMVP